jgi:hypothetical protein
MAAEEALAGLTETISAAGEGACRLIHNRHGPGVDAPSTLLKLGWLAVAGVAQKCAT